MFKGENKSVYSLILGLGICINLRMLCTTVCISVLLVCEGLPLYIFIVCFLYCEFPVVLHTTWGHSMDDTQPQSKSN